MNVISHNWTDSCQNWLKDRSSQPASCEERFHEEKVDSRWYRCISLWNEMELTRIGFSQGNRIRFVIGKDTDHKHDSIGEESVLYRE